MSFLYRALQSHCTPDSCDRSTVSKTLQITYGYTPKTDDDFLIKMIDGVLNDFSAASNPGAYLVDFVPIRVSLVLSHMHVGE
jgi:hypothetical protein